MRKLVPWRQNNKSRTAGPVDDLFSLKIVHGPKAANDDSTFLHSEAINTCRNHKTRVVNTRLENRCRRVPRQSSNCGKFQWHAIPSCHDMKQFSSQWNSPWKDFWWRVHHPRSNGCGTVVTVLVERPFHRTRMPGHLTKNSQLATELTGVLMTVGSCFSMQWPRTCDSETVPPRKQITMCQNECNKPN